MAETDPYHRWSGAPKHWVEIPAQRQAPPPIVVSTHRPAHPPTARRGAAHHGLAVAAIAVAAVVLLLTLAGPGSSVADLDQPPGPAAPITR